MGTNTAGIGEGGKVLVIGAGCAGLALAHGLKKAGIPYVVYERRSNVAPLQKDWSFALHWSAPALQSLIPSELWARIQDTQVDPHTPTKEVDVLRFHNGRTGELIRGVEVERFYRLRRSKLQALLLEGLDVEWEKKIVQIIHSEDGKGVKAFFEDGTEVTGSLLVGADGARSSVRSFLVGSDKAKATPIDFAATVCLTKYSRQRALFLRSEPHHPLFQIAPHPDGYYSWLGLHDASDSNHPENWEFFQYISFPEPRGSENKKTVLERVADLKAMAAQFADPWKSSFEWIPDDITTAWYAKLSHWDPALPEHKWDNRGGLITLAGDAAHPMTFQRGQGLNHALTDSVQLCKAIVDCWHSSENFPSGRAAAVEVYEKEMIARTSEEVRLGEVNSKMLHDWEQVQQSPVFGKGVRK